MAFGKIRERLLLITAFDYDLVCLAHAVFETNPIDTKTSSAVL